MLFPAWLYTRLDTPLRPGRAVFNEACFSLAGCSEEHRNGSPDREAHRSWKLKALFTLPAQKHTILKVLDNTGHLAPF